MRTLLIADRYTDRLEEACRAGIGAIQLRNKEATAKELYEWAVQLRNITQKWGVKLLINERTDIALAVGADGVHYPENAQIFKSREPVAKLPAPEKSMILSQFAARQVSIASPGSPTMHHRWGGNRPGGKMAQKSDFAGPGSFATGSLMLVGKSVHSLQSALQAESQGADYLLFGPVFETPLKPIPQGLDKLKEVASNVKIPVYAVGGIIPDQIPSLLQSNAAGAAAISYFQDAPDLAEAVRKFRAPFFRIQGLLAIVSTIELAKRAIEGGADSIQFRHKGIYDLETLAIAKSIRSLCQQANIPFLINDRADIALAIDASGVHLGQTDLPIDAARKLLGPNKTIGGTASNPEEAKAAEELGADYIGYGHIFPTQSKEKPYPPIGIDAICKAKACVKIPLIAIGGINEQNIDSVLKAGADGAAILSAIPNARKIKQRMLHGL